MPLKRLVHRILDLAADSVPNAIAATLGDETLTFGEADRRASLTARALEQLRVRPRDRVALWSAIGMRNLDVYFGTLRCGASFVSLNPDYSADEAQAMLEYSKVRVLIVDWPRREAGEAIAAKLGIPLAVVGASGRNAPGSDFDASCAAASDRRPELVGDEEDFEAIFLTSGSTGRPKGVTISHRATWTRAFEQNTAVLPACGGPGDVLMFPLFHFAGWIFLLNAWTQRRAIHLPLSTDGEALLGQVARWQAGALYCIPAVWERVLAVKREFDTRSLHSVNTGTSRVEPDLIARLRARFPGRLVQVHYGSTEIGRGLSICDSEIEKKPYSVGISAPGVDSKIVDGELWQRGISMASGYFELPEQTTAAFEGGWYHTGDLVERDADGYYTITGRRREVIRSGGEWIAPAEVEAALKGLAGVRDVAIVGLPDPKWDEVVCAALVLEAGKSAPQVEALRRHLEGKLASFKHPRKVVVVDSLPRTSATGQIQRSQVRDRILNLDRQG
jgi:fatty-acyl-CoA synthase